jgi:hypothetical protein
MGSHMKNNLQKQLNKEMLNFLGLAIINLIFSAIILAVGIMFIVNHFYRLNEYSTLINPSIGFIVMGIIFSVIGFWWILKSSYVMDFITDIQWEIYWTKILPSEEQITSSIIKLVAYYRENTDKIKKMMFISRVGGIIFIIQSIYYIIDLLIYANLYHLSEFYYIRILATIIMIFWGILSLYIPHFIINSASIWDERLKKSQEAEDTIRTLMERV